MAGGGDDTHEASLGLQEIRQCVFSAINRTPEVCVHQTPHHIEVKVDEQGAHRDTRVIYQYIDTSKTFDGLLDKVATIVLDSDIRLDTQHFRRLRHLRLYLKELVIGAGCEYKFSAF